MDAAPALTHRPSWFATRGAAHASRECCERPRRALVIGSRGCTLVEVLVATACLVVMVAFAAQAYAAAAQATHRASRISRATILAQDKIEELVARAAAGGQIGNGSLDSSPPDALSADVDGWYDSVAGFVRRWSVEPLPAAPSAALIVQVVVTPGEQHASSFRSRTSSGAHLVTVRRRSS